MSSPCSKTSRSTIRIKTGIKGSSKTVFEGVIGGVTDLLKNTPRDELATKVDVSGPVQASPSQHVANRRESDSERIL